MTIQFCHCSPALQKLTNKFYKKFKTNVSCNLQDQAYCALHNEQGVIAAVILRKIESSNEYLLRSLFVAPEYRSQGIAKRLCKLALSTDQKPCYTLCESHLVPFYQALGFTYSSTQLASPNISKQIKKGLRLLKRRPSI